ncbi:UNVERIFIED_CONTAM: Membrane proteins related to metalloendopeptidases [Acetivibrio alkalicellulosi]
MIRNKYQRQVIQGRRKSRKSRRVKVDRESFNIIQKIMFKAAICMLILAICGIVKGIDSSVTNYLEHKIIDVLSYNVDVKSLFNRIDGYIRNVDKEDANYYEIIGVSDSVESDNVKNEDISEKKYNEYLDNSEYTIIDKNIYEEMVDSITYDGSSQSIKRENEHSFIIPVGGIIGSFFGEPIYLNGEVDFCKGIDIEARLGTPIKAAYQGEVVELGEDLELGKYIKIRHDENIMSVYGNCSVLKVNKGQYVNKGDIIAKVGNTGRSEEASLCFMVLNDGTLVNPLDYIVFSYN